MKKIPGVSISQDDSGGAGGKLSEAIKRRKEKLSENGSVVLPDPGTSGLMTPIPPKGHPYGKR